MPDIGSLFQGGTGIAIVLFLFLWAIVAFFLPFYVMAIHTKNQQILRELKDISSQLEEGIKVYPVKPDKD